MELDVDIVLKFGRNFQQTDSVYHGATWDTAKLLCDTIERLRDQVERAKSLVSIGYWAYLYYYSAVCSVCGEEIYTNFETTNEAVDEWNTLCPYCPHCGANMEYKKPNIRRRK